MILEIQNQIIITSRCFLRNRLDLVADFPILGFVVAVPIRLGWVVGPIHLDFEEADFPILGFEVVGPIPGFVVVDPILAVVVVLPILAVVVLPLVVLGTPSRSKLYQQLFRYTPNQHINFKFCWDWNKAD